MMKSDKAVNFLAYIILLAFYSVVLAALAYWNLHDMWKVGFGTYWTVSWLALVAIDFGNDINRAGRGE